MSYSVWEKYEEIFPLVADLPENEREERLRELCAGDEALRGEISALLKADEKAADFIESPISLPVSLSQIYHRTQSGNIETTASKGRRFGAYRVVGKLGAGGMGAVYLAERADGEFNKKAAIKLVKRGADTDFNLRRFRHERQVLAALEHPNIARLLDGGTADDGSPFLVMEYVEGKPLLDYCTEHDLNLTEKLQLFRQVLAAIAYAHEQGVIHRDIKPGNILVARSGAVKLLDFGIAKILDADLIHDSIGQTDTLFRQMTPEYASPEQICGDEITPSSDIYSLGVVLYELLSGERPYKFTSRAPHEIARVICEQVVSAPQIKGETALAEDLQYIVLKALQKKPSDRYAAVPDFDDDLQKFLAESPVRKMNLPIESGVYAVFARQKSAATESVSLAIAPFEVLTDEDESNAGSRSSKEFLGIGLADALATKLSGVRRIAVRPTGSVMRLAATLDAKALGEALNADYVLTGRIWHGDRNIRVTVQLLNVAGNSILWAQSFDEAETDIFSLQDSISERVAASLVPQLTTEEKETLYRHGTQNAEAYELYLRGRAYFHNYTFGGISAAENCFAKAIERDPNFALAHSALADFYNLQTVFGLTSNEEGFTRAKKSARRALELNPQSAEAHTALAFTTWAYDWDFSEAERLFQRAIKLNPKYPRAREWYAFLLSVSARHEEALAEMRLAEQFDPNSPALLTMFSLVFYNARRYEEALEKTRRALELDPDYYIALQSLGWICPRLGKYDEGVEACRRAVRICDEQALNKFSLALALVDAGQTREARAIAAELENRRRNEQVPAYYPALVYVALGEDEKAFAWLDEAIKERGYYTLRMSVEPRFDRLRSDARFIELLKALKPLSEAKTVALKPRNSLAEEACRRGRAAAETYTFEGIAASEKFFQEAIAHDAEFAPAYSGLADFYNWQTIAGLVPPASVLPSAKRSARRAVELDPNCSEGYASLAFAIWAGDWDFSEAERLYRKSIALDPKNAKAREWFSYLLSAAGRHDEAVAEMQRAERLDPHSPTIAAMFGLCFYYARRYKEAEAKLRRSLELDPHYYLARLGLSWICPPLGRFEEAVEHARRAVEIGDELIFNKFSLALALIAAGQTAEARQIAAEIEQRRRERFAPAYFPALIYANLGESDTAFRWLDKAIRERGFWTLWLRVEPRFDALREDPRFAEKLEQIKSPENAAPTTADASSAKTGETETHGKSKIQTARRFKTVAAVFAAVALVFVGFYALFSFGIVIEKFPADKGIPQTASSPDGNKPQSPVNEKPRTSDALADELYQAGKQQLETRSLDGVNRAIKLFGEAVKRDPNFALAHSGLADAHIVLADKDSKAAPTAYRTAEEHALKALALDPDLAEARTSLAMTTYKNTKNVAAAEKHFLRAIEINPRLSRAHHWYSQILKASGRDEEALREIKIAAELEPRSAVIHFNVGVINVTMERYEEAIAYFDKAIELDSGYTNTYLSKAIVQQMLGDYSGARETYRIGRIHSGKDENEPLWIMFQAQAHAAEGRRDEALTMLNRLLRSNSAEREEMKKLTFDIALVYNLLGERETACEWLGKIESKLIEDPKKLSRDPRLAALRESACFGKLIEKWQNERQARR